MTGMRGAGWCVMRGADLAGLLARLDLDVVARDALRDAAEGLAARVRDVLSVREDGAHAQPWLRSGALRESIAASSEGDVAVVGSVSGVAVAQECGTERIPPRPFLGPVAVCDGALVAEAVGAAVAAALAGIAQ